MHPNPLRCIIAVVILGHILEIFELRFSWDYMATTVEAIVYHFISNSARRETPGMSGTAPSLPPNPKWEFPKIRVPYFGALIMWILPLRGLYWGPLFSKKLPNAKP